MQENTVQKASRLIKMKRKTEKISRMLKKKSCTADKELQDS
jgi:hypothetical protein